MELILRHLNTTEYLQLPAVQLCGDAPRESCVILDANFPQNALALSSVFFDRFT